MKKISKASELMWLLGVVLVALGVAICSKANLGVSMIAAPAFVVREAVAALWSWVTVGVVEYILQGVLLLLLCVLNPDMPMTDCLLTTTIVNVPRTIWN